MALLPESYTPDEDDKDPFAPIPDAWYEAEVFKSAYKITKDKTGGYIELGFKVLEGPHTGKMIFTNLNIKNKNATAVKIAKKDLYSICTACSIDGELEDTEDLHDIPMGIKLSIKEANSNWPAKNEIKNFCHIDELQEKLED